VFQQDSIAPKPETHGRDARATTLVAPRCEISALGRAIHLWSSPERIENPPLLSGLFHTIFRRMLRLTKQEQLVLCVVLSLLLVGWTVRAWRAAHPAAASNKRTK